MLNYYDSTDSSKSLEKTTGETSGFSKSQSDASYKHKAQLYKMKQEPKCCPGRAGESEKLGQRHAKGFAAHLLPRVQLGNLLLQGTNLTLCSFILFFSAEPLTSFLVIWKERHWNENTDCFNHFNTFNTERSLRGGQVGVGANTLQNNNGNLSGWPVPANRTRTSWLGHKLQWKHIRVHVEILREAGRQMTKNGSQVRYQEP